MRMQQSTTKSAFFLFTTYAICVKIDWDSQDIPATVKYRNLKANLIHADIRVHHQELGFVAFLFLMTYAGEQHSSYKQLLLLRNCKGICGEKTQVEINEMH